MARFATTPCATQLQPALQVVSAPTIHAVGAVFGILQQAVRTVACTAVAEAIRFQRKSVSTSARARRRHRRHRRQRRFTAAIAAARTVSNRGVIRMRSTALIAMRSALKYPLGTIARLTVSVLAARSYHDSGGDANRWTSYIILYTYIPSARERAGYVPHRLAPLPLPTPFGIASLAQSVAQVLLLLEDLLVRP